MLVQKYGGSSVATIEQILEIAKNLKQTLAREKQIVVVVSAMGKSTNNLRSLANKISPDVSGRELDQLLSTGENITASLLAMALQKENIKAKSLTGFQANIITDNNYNCSFIKHIDVQKIMGHFKDNDILIITGFQGVSTCGDITTFGAGGSDTTAVALAGVLNCKCQIYSDIDAVHTIDPKILPHAKKLRFLSYDELIEMSSCGAKVMETRSVEIAKKFNVNLYIGKSLEKGEDGTFVMDKESFIESMIIKNITSRNNVVQVNIKLSQIKNIQYILQCIKDLNEKIEMFSMLKENEKYILSFICNEEKIDNLIKNIKKINKNNKKNNILIKKSENLSKVTILGSGFSTHIELVQEVFKELESNNIQFSNIALNELSLSFIVEKKLKHKTIICLAKLFNL